MTSQTAEEYLASLPDGRRQEIETLHHLILDNLPELDTHMWGSVIGYGLMHYRYASGREGDWFLVGLSSRKNYISLYVSCADENGYLAEQSKAQLGKVKVGRSCITFRKLADLDQEALKELLQRARTFAEAGQFAM
jgi:hypothetical protein